jgi:Putative DNA-binding domain
LQSQAGEFSGTHPDYVMPCKSGPSESRVQGLIDGPTRQEISEQINGAEAVLSLESEIGQIESLQLFVTAPEGTLDLYEQNPLHHGGRFRWLAGSPERDSQSNKEDLLTEIRKGEGLNLEFKPYVRIAQGDTKRLELIETAIAFANSSGGIILVGVNKTGSPQKPRRKSMLK